MPVVNQKRPVGCPRSVHTPFAHRAPWLLPSQLVKMPATSPASLIARPELVVPQPSGYPRSVIVPLSQRKACRWPDAVRLSPVTCPAPLIPYAELEDPPSVPRSVMTPSFQRKALQAEPDAGRLVPTTSPALLMLSAVLEASPGRVPRSAMTPSCQRKAWDSPEPIVLQPTTWPASLRSVARLRLPPGSVPRSRIAGKGEAGGAENCTVRVGGFADSLQDWVTWYTSCVTPLFVIRRSRCASVIVEPVGTCPEFGPMKAGNLINVLQTVVEDVLHPEPSTNSFGLVPKF